MSPRPRLRIATLWLIGVLAALDVVGAAYLHRLWIQRHPQAPQADLAPQPRSVRLDTSDSPRPPVAARVSSTR